MVVGVFHPCVLLPAGLRDRLAPQQLNLIIAHELAHVRRRDALLSLVQRVIGAVYFHNPVVHWISRRIDRERECACDDRAIGDTGDSTACADSSSTWRVHVAGAPVPAMAIGAIGRPSQLRHRIERLLAGTSSRAKRASLAALGATSSLVLVAAVVLAPAIPLAKAAERMGAPVVIPAAETPIAAADAPRTVAADTSLAASRNSVAGRAMGRVLIEAAQSGDLHSAEELITSGADVNFAMPGDGTPLIVAARHGNEKLVKLLLDHGGRREPTGAR